MPWECADCGATYEEHTFPCIQCASENIISPQERRSQPIEDPADVTWRCADCGHEHQRNSPPCNRCGSMQLEAIDTSQDDTADRAETSGTTPPPPVESEWDDPPTPSESSTARTVATWLLLIGAVAAVFGGLVYFDVIFPELLSPDPCADYRVGAADETTLYRNYLECEIHEAVNEFRTSRGRDTLAFSGTRWRPARTAVNRATKQGWDPDEMESEIGDGIFQNCENERRWAVFQQIPYGTRIRNADGERMAVESNGDVVEAILANIKKDDRTTNVVLERQYTSHAVAVNATSRSVRVIHIFC